VAVLPVDVRTTCIPVKDLQPGMIVGKTILSEAGQVILDENIALNDSLIQLLAAWKITEVHISVPPESENVSELFRKNQSIAATHSEIVETIKTAFEKIRYLREVPIEQLKELAGRCIDSLLSTSCVLYQLVTIRDTDDYTFMHSVNVGVTAGVIGKWMNLSGAPLHDLVLAGLLHDVGKTQIPLPILNKPGKLTPAEMYVMKKHAPLGYELLNEKCQLPETVLSGVLQHHERMDGSGYPENLAADSIGMIARIIAVADTLDAMTSNRVYRAAVTPFSVIHEFSSLMFNKLAPEVITVFLENINASLLGSIVRLSDGSTAKVIYIDKDHLDRPTVQTPDGQYIALGKKRDLQICEILAGW
jgi:HD-GYP domain-containing protein (c-di-GMP phosphodiesterase class II)